MKFLLDILLLVGLLCVSVLGNEERFESLIHQGDGHQFLMKFLVGTPPTPTHLIIDTGSDLTWIQCTPCVECFAQTTPFFNPRRSATYRNLSCHSPRCQNFPRRDGSVPNCSSPSGNCSYSYAYTDLSSTVGVLATETFTFQMVNGSVTNTTDYVFGCGHNNQMSFPSGGSGVVGLGRGIVSLISQLGSTVEKKFSYCLPKSTGFSSKFKFGSNASIFPGQKVFSTPLLPHDMYPTLYSVALEGITVGGKRLQSKQVMFRKGNTVIDSGSILTYIEPELYDMAISTLRELIGVQTIEDSSKIYNLCYPKVPFSQASEQKFIFHFTGADVELKNVNFFMPVRDMICFSMAPSVTGFNVYGNVAQMDFEVLYNLESNVLSFAPANCSQFPRKNEAGSKASIYSYFLCITLGLVRVLIMKL